MPRYYFHIFNDETSLDDEGRQLPDLEAARAHAVEGARSLMTDAVKGGSITLSHHISVENEQGQLLMNVTFGDALEVRP